MKVIKVHKLVALTFLPNPLHLPSINHIDENKLNNGELINTFDSIKEAVNNTGFQKGYIIACCKGKKESYKKYKWKYETI